MSILISPSTLPASIMLAVVFGSFVHDAQLNSVASIMVKVAKNGVVSSHYASGLLKPSTHVPLVEALVLSNGGGQQITAQPRNQNDKKYLSPRRTATNHVDNDYRFPVI